MRPAIFEQFVLRIGLPGPAGCSPRATTRRCTCRAGTPWSTTSRGSPHGNEIVRIPEATKGAVDEVPAQAASSWSRRRRDEPRLFDGSRAPPLDELLTGPAAHRRPSRSPSSGSASNVAGSRRHGPAARRAPGRNIGVIGAARHDAVACSAPPRRSLGEQHDPGEVRLRARPARRRAPSAAAAVVHRRLAGHDVTIVRLDGFRQLVERARPRRSRDAARRSRPHPDLPGALRRRRGGHRCWRSALTEALRKVLRFGPETGVHTIGWWRSPRGCESLLLMSASPDDLGCVRRASTCRAPSSARCAAGAAARLVAAARPGAAASTGRGTRGRRSSSSRPDDGASAPTGPRSRMSGPDGARTRCARTRTSSAS